MPRPSKAPAAHPQPPAADPRERRESYRDVHRACHRWLMDRDPFYAKAYTTNSEAAIARQKP